MQKPIITIYTTPICAFCHQAKEYLKSRGYDYTDKDITTDQDALKFVVEEVGQAVTPIIIINKTTIIGFDLPKIEEALVAAASTS